MSDIFRLDEVLMPLLDKWNNDLEDLAEDIGAEYDDLYDLLYSPHPEEGEVSINGFAFCYRKSVRKALDDYCEGKSTYEVISDVKDVNGEVYEIVCSKLNDEVLRYAIKYKGDVRARVAQCCNNPYHSTIKASGITQLTVVSPHNTYSEMPAHLQSRFGNNPRELEFQYCVNCHKVILP